jgi:DEAD/DEAH box helicase domain-containing protein
MKKAILKDPASSAIYLYPTKALAQDQLRSLRNFLRGGTEALLHVKCFTYDGDVPQESRGLFVAHVYYTNAGQSDD